MTNRWPLIEKGMTRPDYHTWLKQNGYPLPPKSSCLFCPYYSEAAWLEIKEHSPDEWQTVVELDRKIRTGLPKLRGQAYLHRSMMPLDQVAFNAKDGERQPLFENECEGMCGV